MPNRSVVVVTLLIVLPVLGCSGVETADLVSAARFDSATTRDQPDEPRPAVGIEIEGAAPYYVHAPDAPFSIKVRVDYSGSSAISYHWRDFRGRAYTEPLHLTPGEATTIQSPDTRVGYYGLVFEADDARVALPDRQPGEQREYGFVILPHRSTADRLPDPGSRFGIVHADREDPYLPQWIKTATWKTYHSTSWKSQMDRRRTVGTLELPLIVDDEWDSDDSRPIFVQELAALEARMAQYFRADRRVLYWELGLEENKKPRFRMPNYWGNLAAKADAVRSAADAVNPDVKLIYQIATTEMRSIRKFLESSAASTFDVLSLHPYEWPDFPTPEVWLVDFLNEVRNALAANGRAGMPVWLTEVGAPHHGNAPGEFFGYPSSGNPVTGLSREQAVSYMVKIHVLALHGGVDKLFWYNYIDRGEARNHAEAHFGIRDFWGFPKPVYAAYFNLHDRLKGKSPSVSRQLPNGAWIRGFRGPDLEMFVVWAHPGTRTSVPWSALRPGLSVRDIAEVIDAVGTPLPYGGQLRVTGEPVFVVTRPFVP